MADIFVDRADDKKAVIDRLMNSNVEDNVSILPVGHLLCFSSHKQSIYMGKR
jgi:hypothetical protein